MDKVIRCAIYTRKSTDEGLEKEFNTLEAQREAGSSYIASQKHQGWQEVAMHYDDGGFSGGNLERPVLQRLLEDVKADKIDMIVVYKIDRLTRSLLDFAKLIDVLDNHHCSFVAVTQNFNTYDSMGRLTLNVLLSFAQFEREVITERIRDKVAASKKKGMWMGGTIPLGYDVIHKKLVINEEVAETVRFIFEQYRLHQSELYVVNLLREKGIYGKKRVLRDGTEINGGYITHARLSNLLKNPIYIGKIPHKDKLYDGQHKAIITGLNNTENIFMNEQPTINAEDIKAEERKRMADVLVSDVAKGKEATAQMLLTETNLSADKIKAILQTVPVVKENAFEQAMANIKNPAITPATETAEETPEAVAKRIASYSME